MAHSCTWERMLSDENLIVRSNFCQGHSDLFGVPILDILNNILESAVSACESPLFRLR